ncbi:hypothetical protein FACS1894217_10820 [Clostridia bacterium]|nr:hypothetical protein FACS1894217_10820 [Clostridia bacterium]
MLFSVLGDDERQRQLARLLRLDGHTVFTEVSEAAEVVVWGVPTPANAGEFLRRGQVAVGGRVPAGTEVIDYTRREDFATANAVPSVEGALQIAMQNTRRTLHGAAVLVVGFGRIGKLLARGLKALGAVVTVSARSAQDFKWCEVLGYNRLDTRRLEGQLGGFEIIFNTVPSMVLDDERLAELRPGVLVIDLASAPGGVDSRAAKNRGIRCLWELGLPARVAPDSAAEILRDTVYAIVAEQKLT